MHVYMCSCIHVFMFSCAYTYLQVARTGLELQGLGAQLGVRLVITPPHHPSLHLHHHHRPTVKSALDQAKVSAAVAGPLVHLPHWVRRPSRLQRHWLRFTAAALLAVWAGRWLYRHSSLSGSDDLARWTREAVQVGGWGGLRQLFSWLVGWHFVHSPASWAPQPHA